MPKKPAATPKPSQPKARPTPTGTGTISTAIASSLPATIVNALPTGARIAVHITAIEALLPQLQHELEAANKAGITQFARAFVVFHRLNERMLSEEKAFKPFKQLYGEYKNVKFPEALEQSGMDNVPLSEGFRVGVTVNVRASVVPGQKEAAFAWLAENEKGDLIQPTLNASTLSAFAREMREKNKDLPADIFAVAEMPGATVTKT